MYIPKNNRYTVSLGDNGLFYINDKRLQSTRSYSAREFVYGQMSYNEETADYPGYVHEQVWNLDSQSRGYSR